MQETGISTDEVRAVVHLLGLAAEAAAGITRVAQQVHSQIFRSIVSPLEFCEVPPVHEAVYEIVHGSFKLSAGAARQWPGSAWPEQAHWQKLLGVVRGVVGDHLDASSHPLGHDFLLLDRSGEVVTLDSLGSQDRVAVFVHGLCMNESSFADPGFQAMIDTRVEAGWVVYFARYNSGLSIVENGRSLASTLAQLPTHRLMLLGHSMGGLVIRSAYEQAEAAVWRDRLQLTIYLGTPHTGAPLERLGYQAVSLFGLLPWTQPLMQLGMVRSQGIQDLRYANIGHEVKELPHTAEHLLIAAQLRESIELPLVGQWLGDGLVPVNSALAQDEQGNSLLQAPRIRREYFPDVGHLGLLSNSSVLECIDQVWK